MKIYTIGYEGLDVAAFMSLLAENAIETVVDVREMPLSRKPGFSKKVLENALNLAGREYVHMVALGCPKPVRDRYREDGNWSRYTERFLEYLATQEDSVAELSALAATSDCALLCFEADYNHCHRSLVSDAVKHYAGVQVRHIQASGARTKNSPAMSPPAFA